MGFGDSSGREERTASDSGTSTGEGIEEHFQQRQSLQGGEAAHIVIG